MPPNAPKLIDPIRKGVPLQPERQGRVRCNAWRLWTHCSIEQGHELPDDKTRKDGHGNVSRLDPPRVAILPTATDGNNNSVLIPKVAQMAPRIRAAIADAITQRLVRAFTAFLC